MLSMPWAQGAEVQRLAQHFGEDIVAQLGSISATAFLVYLH